MIRGLAWCWDQWIQGTRRTSEYEYRKDDTKWREQDMINRGSNIWDNATGWPGHKSVTPPLELHHPGFPEFQNVCVAENPPSIRIHINLRENWLLAFRTRFKFGIVGGQELRCSSGLPCTRHMVGFCQCDVLVGSIGNMGWRQCWANLFWKRLWQGRRWICNVTMRLRQSSVTGLCGRRTVWV